MSTFDADDGYAIYITWMAVIAIDSVQLIIICNRKRIEHNRRYSKTLDGNV